MKEHNQSLLLPANLAGDIDNLRDDLCNERDGHPRTLANKYHPDKTKGDKATGEENRSLRGYDNITLCMRGYESA